MNPSSPRYLVWTVDPFERETRPDTASVLALVRWAEVQKATLQAVYIISNSDELSGVEKTLKQYLKDLGLENHVSSRVLVEGDKSREAVAERILEYVTEVNSPMIVVTSHGRSGLERLVLGSFAESLLRYSTRPLLFINQGSGNSDLNPTRVLFPTDFSDLSRAAYRRLLRIPRVPGPNQSEIVLFYAVNLPAVASGGFGSMAGVPAYFPENYFVEQEEWAKKEGENWVTEAKQAGFEAKMLVVDIGVGPGIGHAILEAAEKEKVNLIGMASMSGPVATLVAGSIAREVFRTKRFPVWVCGPHSL